VSWGEEGPSLRRKEFFLRRKKSDFPPPFSRKRKRGDFRERMVPEGGPKKRNEAFVNRNGTKALSLLGGEKKKERKPLGRIGIPANFVRGDSEWVEMPATNDQYKNHGGKGEGLVLSSSNEKKKKWKCVVRDTKSIAD